MFPQREIRQGIDLTANQIAYLLSGRAPQIFHTEVATLATLLSNQGVKVPPPARV